MTIKTRSIDKSKYVEPIVMPNYTYTFHQDGWIVTKTPLVAKGYSVSTALFAVACVLIAILGAILFVAQATF